MTSSSVALSRTAPGPSAADQVYEVLHRAIISGHFKDGEPLRQEELARQLSTSRIPVREALSRLEQHGLVRIARFRGYTVAGHSRAEVEELCRLRALLEGELIFHAVSRLRGEDLAEARKRCEAFEAEHDPVRWGELNRDFHCALYSAAGMPHHLQVAIAALDRTERYLVDQLELTDGRAQARAEHTAILQACVCGDAEGAARLTRQHILGACERFSAYMDSVAPPS